MARSSADFLAELRTGIVKDARVSVDQIVSVRCGPVFLLDQFGVSQLKPNDVLVVQLRPAVAGVGGQKRGADEGEGDDDEAVAVANKSAAAPAAAAAAASSSSAAAAAAKPNKKARR